MSDDGDTYIEEQVKAFNEANEAFEKNSAVFTCKGSGPDIDAGLILQAVLIDGYEKNEYEKAISFLEPLAKQGHMGTQYALGEIYLNRDDRDDEKKARYWFSKAAKQGHSAAQNNFASLLKNGDGGSKNPTKAKYWFKKAAKQGNEMAQRNLDKAGFGDPFKIFLCIIGGGTLGGIMASSSGFGGFLIGAIIGWIIVAEMRKRL